MKKNSTMFTDKYNVEEAVGHSSSWQKIWWECVEFKITLGGKKKKGKKSITIPKIYHAAIKEKINVWKIQQDAEDAEDEE
jgi:hypothetical protein